MRQAKGENTNLPKMTLEQPASPCDFLPEVVELEGTGTVVSGDDVNDRKGDSGRDSRRKPKDAGIELDRASSAQSRSISARLQSMPRDLAETATPQAD